jgi:hypothetical protein
MHEERARLRANGDKTDGFGTFESKKAAPRENGRHGEIPTKTPVDQELK